MGVGQRLGIKVRLPRRGSGYRVFLGNRSQLATTRGARAVERGCPGRRARRSPTCATFPSSSNGHAPPGVPVDLSVEDDPGEVGPTASLACYRGAAGRSQRLPAEDATPEEPVHAVRLVARGESLSAPEVTTQLIAATLRARGTAPHRRPSPDPVPSDSSPSVSSRSWPFA